MNDYIKLLEEYVYWMQLGKTHGYVTCQIFSGLNSNLFKRRLLSNVLSFIRNDYPIEFKKYLDLQKQI